MNIAMAGNWQLFWHEHIQKSSRWGKTVCSLTLSLIIHKKEQYNGYRNSALVFWWFSSAMDKVKIADFYNLSEGLKNLNLTINQAIRTGKLDCAL